LNHWSSICFNFVIQAALEGAFHPSDRKSRGSAAVLFFFERH
jgi:hypothetical protein